MADAAFALDGTWFLFEVDDEEVEAVLELRDGAGEGWRAGRESERWQVRVGDGGGGLKAIVVTEPNGQARPALWAFQGDGRALVFRRGHDELLAARRAAPIPAALQGVWVIARNDRPVGRPAPSMQITITATRVEMTGPDGAGSGRAWSLASPEGDEQLFVWEVPRSRDRIEMVVMRAQPVPGGYLLWPNGDEDFAVAHRPGQPPGWLQPAP